MDMLFGQTQASMFLAQTDNDARSVLVWLGTLVATDGRMKLVPKQYLARTNRWARLVGWSTFNADFSVKAMFITA